MLNRLLDNRYSIWVPLALPGLHILWPFLTRGYSTDPFLVDSGVWAVRLLVFTLALTPLSLIFRGQRWILWLLRRRRWFGVAAFGYAALHVGLYAWDQHYLSAILFVAGRIYAWPAWVAIAFLIPLALTSNRLGQRLLAKNWKRLQRLTYPVALLVAAHWLLLPRNGPGLEGWFEIALLAGLETIRIALRLRQWRMQTARAPGGSKMHGLHR